MQPQANIEAQYRTLTIVWAALLVAQFLFLFIIFVVKPENYRFDFSKPFLPEGDAVVILALAAVGISTFVMSFVFKSKLLKQAVDEQKTAHVQTALVLACAFCEATALFGFVLAVAFGYQYFFLWFVLGIFGIILHHPKRDDLVAAGYRKQ